MARQLWVVLFGLIVAIALMSPAWADEYDSDEEEEDGWVDYYDTDSEDGRPVEDYESGEGRSIFALGKLVSAIASKPASNFWNFIKKEA